MSSPAIPLKTALGHEELRHRVHRLSQRHRTVLWLVDGTRSLAEVLSMAQKAGASPQHFDDLLRLGLVELSSPPAAAPAPEAPEPEGMPQAVSVPAPAPASAPAPQTQGGSAAAPAAPPCPQGPLARALAETAGFMSEAPPSLPPSLPPAPKALAPARGRGPVGALRSSRRGAAPLLPPVRLDAPLELPVLTEIEKAPEGGPTPSEMALHEQVRALLRTVIQREPPPFTSRVPARLERCETLGELGDLVFDIERYLLRSRRQRKLHEVMPLLREARELLGLGNTRVVGAGGEDLG